MGPLWRHRVRRVCGPGLSAAGYLRKPRTGTRSGSVAKFESVSEWRSGRNGEQLVDDHRRLYPAAESRCKNEREFFADNRLRTCLLAHENLWNAFIRRKIRERKGYDNSPAGRKLLTDCGGGCLENSLVTGMRLTG